MPKSYLLVTLFILSSLCSLAQRIVYSEPDDDDSRRMRFEVIGKVTGNFLVYKFNKNKSYLSAYNNNMEQISKEELEYVPESRLINVDFFPYSDFVYLIYQYEKKRVVYCDAVKVDGMGKRISDVVTLDTTHIGFGGNNKIYTTISSEDKSKLMVFKINSKNKERYILTTLLFDNALTPMRRSRMEIPMEEYKDNLSEFNIDNEGDLVFTKFKRASNETLESSTLFFKSAESDTLQGVNVQPDKLFLDELHVKVDNANRRFFVTSFYYS